MATNFVQDGSTVNYTAAAAVTSGQFIALPAAGTGSKLVGVATVSGVTGDVIPLMTEGVFSVTTKKAGVGEAWAIGDDVYLTSTGDFTETATSNGYAGVAWEVSATGATTGKVRINFGGDPR